MMPTVSRVNSESELQECLVYLDHQGALLNAYLANSTVRGWTTPDHFSLVVHAGERIAGFAHVILSCGAPFDFVVRMFADEPFSISMILSALPKGIGYFPIHTPVMHEYFDRLCKGERRHTFINFVAERGSFLPTVPQYAVRKLTIDDEPLFAGCEGYTQNELGQPDRYVFGIVAQGRIASSVVVATVIDNSHWTKTIAGIGELHTQTVHRRKGFGRTLISFVTQQLLQDHDAVLYYTTPDNTASQRLIAPLGYTRLSESVDYQFRLPVDAATHIV